MLTAPATIHVTGWLATSADPDAIAVDSDDFLVWWLPVLGPTATILAHRLARYASIYGPVDWATDELTRTIGLVDRADRLHAAVVRLERFLLAAASPDHTFVRVRLTVRRPAPNPPHQHTPDKEST